jgi:hypothetical protein
MTYSLKDYPNLRKDLMDEHEQLNRDAARMVGAIKSILNHEREMRDLPKAEPEPEPETELLDIPEVDEEAL